MDTVVLCECGEQAVCNNGRSHADYQCTHCGSFYAIKYKHDRYRDKRTPLDEQFKKNRREWSNKRYKGYW